MSTLELVDPELREALALWPQVSLTAESLTRRRADALAFCAPFRNQTCPTSRRARSTLAVDPELRRSRFAWLRDYSESPAPSNIVAILSADTTAKCALMQPQQPVQRLRRRQMTGSHTVVHAVARFPLPKVGIDAVSQLLKRAALGGSWIMEVFKGPELLG